MNTSSELISEPTELKEIIQNIPGYPFSVIQRLGGGKNSQVYRLENPQGVKYALKSYFQHQLDRRDRLDTEFSGLQFLWDNSIRKIPCPIFANQQQGWAIYDYIEGTHIASEAIQPEDIDQLVELLLKLRNLCTIPSAISLPIASEACFSLAAIFANLQQRLQRLIAVPVESEETKKLQEFLKSEFVPFLEKLLTVSKINASQAGIDFEQDLPRKQCTLSPSDFGFHNALKLANGELIFLDFEYFGWDDPAKMISDFLLHPARVIATPLKQRFFEGILLGFGDDPQLLTRVKIVYPLFGLKWCLILLNEFLSENLLRRGFAEVKQIDIRQRQSEQLLKTKRLFSQIQGDYERFPDNY